MTLKSTEVVFWLFQWTGSSGNLVDSTLIYFKTVMTSWVPMTLSPFASTSTFSRFLRSALPVLIYSVGLVGSFPGHELVARKVPSATQPFENKYEIIRNIHVPPFYVTYLYITWIDIITLEISCAHFVISWNTVDIWRPFTCN